MLICVLTALLPLLWVWEEEDAGEETTQRMRALARRHRIVAGYVVALDPDAPHARLLARDAERWLGVPTVVVVRAVNGTSALLEGAAPLPFYTRMMLSTGRHDHMQIGSPAMLGCLMSHIALWSSFLAVDANRSSSTADDARPATILVLEEDAYLDRTSADRLAVLLDQDLPHAPPRAQPQAQPHWHAPPKEEEEEEEEEWDILLLETGHLTVSGPMRRVGALAMTWDRPPDATPSVVAKPEQICAWMGTRGYLLRPSGAAKLLAHNALAVQVDALLGLVATFDPTFRMLWTRANVAHPRLLTISTVQDRCVKCYMPHSLAMYALALGLIVAASALTTRALILASPSSSGSSSW